MAGIDQVPGVNCQLIARSELLELPYLDLMARLRDEVEENPALEFECDHPLDEIPQYIDGYSTSPRPPEGQERDLCGLAPARCDLRDELLSRIGWVTCGAGREIAAHLIETIDERGYLTAKTLEVAFGLGVEPAAVEEAVRAVQLIAPPGVGARDLKECLLLQLDAMPEYPAHVRQVVEHCDRALELGGWDRLGGSLGITEEQLREALEVVRSKLSPYPGEQYRPPWHNLLPGNPAATRPDVVLGIEGDEITVELLTSTRMRLRVAEAYRRLDDRMRRFGQRAEDEPTRHAREQVRAAQQMVWSLQQRERSIYRITQAIVGEQRDFLLEGALAHRPLTHKRISELTGLHESTVSRATAGKLVQMPSGESAPFSVFFDDALPARTMLRSIVSAEPADAPMTDQELQEALEREGFRVARRTVNKYRRALGIPSSTDRRMIYQAA